MAKRATMNISLTPQLSRYVNQRVASGRYTSASELVRESLRMMQERDAARQLMRKEIMKGLRQARRGQLLDGDETLAELEELLFKRQRRQAG